jgi:hypothetical protein
MFAIYALVVFFDTVAIVRHRGRTVAPRSHPGGRRFESG